MALTSAELISIPANSVDNADISPTAAIDSTKLSYTGIQTNSVARSLQVKSNDIVSVKDFGALGNGTGDDTAAFNNAIQYSRFVYVPPGRYNIAGTVQLYTGTQLFGLCGGKATFGGTDYPGESILNFTGAGTTCFANIDPANPIFHGAIQGLAIQTAARSYVFDVQGLLGWTFQNVRLETTATNGAGFRSVAFPGTPSWLNRFINCEFRVPDASTSYNFDVDFTDSDYIGCAFTGGIGAISRGSGNNKFSACIFDRANASGAGLTLAVRSGLSDGSHKQDTITGCCFDDNPGYGLLLDARLKTDNIFSPSIVGCEFRNNDTSVPYEIFFDNTGNTAAPVMNGTVIVGCSFTEGIRTPYNSTTNWAKIIYANNYSTLSWAPTPPTSSSSAGIAGQTAFGTGFFYWHDGTQWLRVAGTTF